MPLYIQTPSGTKLILSGSLGYVALEQQTSDRKTSALELPPVAILPDI